MEELAVKANRIRGEQNVHTNEQGRSGQSSTSTTGAPVSGQNDSASTPTKGKSSGNVGSSSTAPGGCKGATGAATASTASGGGSVSNSTGGGSSTGAATLHADITGDNQITVCAGGPFYLIAAYSKVVGGNPVAMNSTETAPYRSGACRYPHGHDCKERPQAPFIRAIHHHSVQLI